MAGESPDKSKQRESSAEPTSGSAGAVPEARDPRIAAARDDEGSGASSSASSASSASSGSARGGVDTATRVFSVRELKTDDDEQGEQDRQDDETVEGGADAAEERDEAEGAAEGTEDASEAAEGSEKGSGSDSDASDASDAPESGDERLRAAVAQWVASADEETPEKDSEKAAEAEGSEETDDEPRAEKGEPEAKPAAEAASKTSPKTSPKAAPKWAATADAKAEDEPAEDDEPEDDTSDKADETGKTGAKADADTDADEDGKDSAGDSDGPVDQPTAVFKMPSAKPAVDQPTTMLKLGDAATAAKSTKSAKSTPDGGSEKDGEPKSETAKSETEAGSKPPAEAERTSKFVALKPLDDPSTRKPPPAKPAEPKAEPVAPKAEPAAPKAEPVAKPTADPAEPAKPAAEPVRPAADATAVVPQIGPERTTQQPLPPKPPLDLLAELTNTPPPPPTPLRTLGRRVKIWTPLVLLLVVVFAIAQAVRPLPAPSLALTAKDSYTFEGGKLALPWPGEGQGWMDVDGVGTMGSFGKQTPVAIGSVAKTMTAYVVLKSHPLKTGEDGPSITVDATAEKEGGYNQAGESTLDSVKAGDKLTLQQALSAVMIPSANNIARLLARWDGGTEAAFIEKMNAAAKELGMTNTTYTDASGLKETTVSTAEDQVKLGNAVVKIPALVAITSAASWTDPSGRYFSNYNTLPFLMGAIGIKTGSTTAAGGNLLFAARKKVGGKSVTVVGAILGQHKPKILETVNTVSRTALEAAEDALTSAKILKKGEVVGYVDDKLGGRTPVVLTQDVTAVGWAGLSVKLSFTAGEVPHTAKAGTQVGSLTVGDGSGGVVKVPVALQSELTEPGFSDKLTRIG